MDSTVGMMFGDKSIKDTLHDMRAECMRIYARKYEIATQLHDLQCEHDALINDYNMLCDRIAVLEA